MASLPKSQCDSPPAKWTQMQQLLALFPALSAPPVAAPSPAALLLPSSKALPAQRIPSKPEQESQTAPNRPGFIDSKS
ncbi:hypothetical protein PtA15_17A118 [Puccinia triticina]|uniref:Uncharacterized protein n=1 Tax=Puccinia triticina TaxID=208348 RepID=A0ABY7D8I4_9BASI|nr:uncharacterized protein PtA15_17A118 [Puccinia triticina]WAQ92636.1 hypothetical protein PtA15_17A118 [Puccinia triticina]